MCRQLKRGFFELNITPGRLILARAGSINILEAERHTMMTEWGQAAEASNIGRTTDVTKSIYISQRGKVNWKPHITFRHDLENNRAQIQLSLMRSAFRRSNMHYSDVLGVLERWCKCRKPSKWEKRVVQALHSGGGIPEEFQGCVVIQQLVRNWLHSSSLKLRIIRQVSSIKETETNLCKNDKLAEFART